MADELTAKELDTLARLAHDLGVDLADTEERTQDQIEQIGAETMARLISAMGQKNIARLFVLNFYRGWRFAQTDSREWEERVTGV
jgi:hypothetical protein